MSLRVIFVRKIRSNSWVEQKECVAIDIAQTENMEDAIFALRSHRPDCWRNYVVESDPDLEIVRRSIVNRIIENGIKDRARAYDSTRERNSSMSWPMDKQRGSRVDWSGLVPARIARAQMAWERNQNALRMKNCNIPVNVSAPNFGVSAGRLHQMIDRALRNPISPVEKFWKRPFTLAPYDAQKLYGLMGKPKPRIRVPMRRAAQ